MSRERPVWFWALIVILMMIWMLGGTQAVIYILEGQIILGEIVIIISTIIIVALYYGFEWWFTRRQ
ncbi:MAG: hypothetical protein ABIE55_01895 [Candidatus Aenigmatarchaeota archaeon]